MGRAAGEPLPSAPPNPQLSLASEIMCYDPRPFEPEENFEQVFSDGCIVDSAHGIYIPQIFCQSYDRSGDVSEEDWEICLSGPDHEFYWEAWMSVLDNWFAVQEAENGKKFRYFLDQDMDLFLMYSPV